MPSSKDSTKIIRNMNKTTTLEEIYTQLNSGMLIALGGMTLYRRPAAFVRELIRYSRKTKKITDLTLVSFTGGIESDWMVGERIVSSVRTCYFGLEIFGLAPMFTYFANRDEINIIEESEASIAYGLKASMADVGFMAGRGWIGTDMLSLRPDVKVIADPYSGEELVAFPAIRPQVSIIHALEADLHGNAHIGKNKGVDIELALGSDRVFITAEKIVPELEEADIVSPLVDGVVEIQGGAQPTSCYPNYQLNGEEILRYTESVSDPQSFNLYIKNLLAD